MADQFVYSPIDFCGDCYAAGFRVGKGLATVLAISGAETAGTYDPKITNTAGNSPPSTDRGILQINSYWHPEVSDACAFDPGCSAVQGFRISSQGTNFAPWATFNNGAYKNYLHVAWMAIDAFQRLQQVSSTVTGLNAQVASLNQQIIGDRAKLADLQNQNTSLQNTITQLQGTGSQLQQQIITLQSQLQDTIALRDAAVARAETAEGIIQQMKTGLDSYLSGVRQQIVGS